MKKYYRNRQASFLQAIAAKRMEAVKQLELEEQKKEKKKKKIAEKVLNKETKALADVKGDQNENPDIIQAE